MEPPETRSVRSEGKKRKFAGAFIALLLTLLWQQFFVPSFGKNISTILPMQTYNLRSYTVQNNAEIPPDPFSRISLMGQFNYGKLPPESLLLWTNNMKQHGSFADVVIRGKFWGEEANETVHTLQSEYGIDIRPSPKTPNEGYFAPYLNMASYMKELQQSNNSLNIDGVLYLHDDAIPNLKFLKTVFQQTKNLAVVGTDLGNRVDRNSGRDGSYEDPRDIQNKRQWYSVQEEDQDSTERKRKEESEEEWRRRMALNYFRIYPFGFSNSTRGSYHENVSFGQTTENQRPAYTNVFGNVLFDNITHIYPKLERLWSARVREKIYSFAADPESWPYLEYEDSSTWTSSGKIPSQADTQGTKFDYFLLVPKYTQADFLYIPLKYADMVLDLSRLLYKHKLWLEGAFPIIVDQISRRTRATSNKGKTVSHKHVPVASVVTVPLCTNWGLARNTLQMINECEGWWHHDVVQGNLPLFYQHHYAGSVNPNATAKGEDFSFGHNFGAFHPIKLGKNSSRWEEVMNLVNGK